MKTTGCALLQFFSTQNKTTNLSNGIKPVRKSKNNLYNLYEDQNISGPVKHKGLCI